MLRQPPAAGPNRLTLNAIVLPAFMWSGSPEPVGAKRRAVIVLFGNQFCCNGAALMR